MTIGTTQPVPSSFMQFSPPAFPFMATPFADGLKGLTNGQWPGAVAWPPGGDGSGSPAATQGSPTAVHWQADPTDPLLAPILQRQDGIQAQAVARGSNGRPLVPTDIFSRNEIDASLHARAHSTQLKLGELGRQDAVAAVLRHERGRDGQAVMDSCRALALPGAQDHPDEVATLRQRLTDYLDAAKDTFEGTCPNWDSAAFRLLQKLERALEALLAKIGPQELTRQLQADLAPGLLEVLSRKYPGECATTLLPKLTRCLNPEAFAIQQGNMRRYGNGLAALLREAEKLPYLLDEPAASTPSADTPKGTSALPPFPVFTGSPYPPLVFSPTNTFSPVNTVSPVISTAAETGTPSVARARTTVDQSTQVFETRSGQDDVRDRSVGTHRRETGEIGTDPMEPDALQGNLRATMISDSNSESRMSTPDLALRQDRTQQRDHVNTEESSNGTVRTTRHFRHAVNIPPNAGMMTVLRPGSRDRFTINGSSEQGVPRQDVRIAHGADVINDSRIQIVAGTLREGYNPQHAPFVRVGPQLTSIRNLNHRGLPYAPGQTLIRSATSSSSPMRRMPSPLTTLMAGGRQTLQAPRSGAARPEIRASNGTWNGARDPLVSSVPPPPDLSHPRVTPGQLSSPVLSTTLRRSSSNDPSRDDDVGPGASSSSTPALDPIALLGVLAQEAVKVAKMRSLRNAGTFTGSSRAGA
ncbi:hypothetical protein [Stenotrophomonas tumulicola]|uniref:Uncharacterized protein n=1 Tax=Stenotrophomonas tumulicola TaxID=1685415 RepID=A0A7W3FM26_9GAMM|nr:hypothetical protein [Stenotrophomonas tumulicola]MBA8682068.1 hypothetical protein [Stenotrophomonas tumulicola]